MTEQLTAAIDDAITVAAHRFDAALELLLVEHERLEQLGAMRAIAERLAASSSSPPCPPGAAAEPADRLDTSSSGVSPAAVGRDGLTEKQSALLSAVNALGECTAAQVAEHVGRDDVPAVKQGLLALRRRGLIDHNGKPTTLARYLRSTGGGSVAAREARPCRAGRPRARRPDGLGRAARRARPEVGEAPDDRRGDRLALQGARRALQGAGGTGVHGGRWSRGVRCGWPVGEDGKAG